MSAELEKTYDPAAVEAQTYRAWMEEKCFEADPFKPGPPYSIVIPPPNVTGALHLGHAINNTLQDILIRVHRMRGYNTAWIPGIDHAGIATQAVVEKQLKEKENKTRHDVGRDGLVARIWEWKQQYGDRILTQLQRLGCSCDWTRTHFTLDDMCARAVRETFFKLFKDGLIYRGKRLVNWDAHLQTSISDDEIYHQSVKTFLWHIKYPIQGTDQFMVVATTRPETLLGDTAVAVHSQDPRWNQYIGQSVQLPLTGRTIPIIADDILVDREFGSGVVKVTPAHDPNDYAVYQRHLNQADAIQIINLLNPDGTMNQNAGTYAGMKRDAARKKVVQDLGDLLIKEEPYETQVGHSDRSKTAVEPYLSDQWFVTMAPLADPALEVVRDGTIQFFPERHAQQYLSWLGEKRDWPISRQLWWGHRIPVWSRDGHIATLDAPAKYCARFDQLANRTYVCLGENNAEAVAALEKDGFIQDPDVLDTWFSSALWPFSTFGWPDQTADLARWYPTSVLMTGRDIITLWVARMVMMGIYNRGAPPLTPGSAGGEPEITPGQKQRSIPFHHVCINPTILDGKGERMSKSKGNGVDPVDIIDTHGADALRFTLTNMATETQDVRLPVKKDAQGRNSSDKFDLGRNFCTKLWNAAKFVLNTGLVAASTTSTQAAIPLADRWIVSRFNRAVTDSNAALSTYRFDQYAKACYDFFWRDFCDWYVEAAKPALKDPARSTATSLVLQTMLDGILRLMHPIIPFITERIWWQLDRPTRLIHATWPVAGQIDLAAEDAFSQLQEVIIAVRNVRNEYKIDPKKPVTVSMSILAHMQSQIDSNRELIESLAICTIARAEINLPTPANAARASAAGIDLFVEGVIDPNAEQQRAAKRKEVLAQKIAAHTARLANPSYADRAPAHLVQQTKDELSALETELAKLN